MAKEAVKEVGERLPNVSYPTHLQSSQERALTKGAGDIYTSWHTDIF